MDKYYCNIYPGYVFSCPSVGWSVGCWVGHFPKRAESKNRLFLDDSWINVLTCVPVCNSNIASLATEITEFITKESLLLPLVSKWGLSYCLRKFWQFLFLRSQS